MFFWPGATELLDNQIQQKIIKLLADEFEKTEALRKTAAEQAKQIDADRLAAERQASKDLADARASSLAELLAFCESTAVKIKEATKDIKFEASPWVRLPIFSLFFTNKQVVC